MTRIVARVEAAGNDASHSSVRFAIAARRYLRAIAQSRYAGYRFAQLARFIARIERQPDENSGIIRSTRGSSAPPPSYLAVVFAPRVHVISTSFDLLRIRRIFINKSEWRYWSDR